MWPVLPALFLVQQPTAGLVSMAPFAASSRKRTRRQLLTCKTCMQPLPDAAFDQHKLAAWRKRRRYTDVVCSTCSSMRAGPFGRGAKVGLFTRGSKFTCQQCNSEKDVCLYDTKAVIRHARLGTECDLVCLHCSPSQARHLNHNSYACTRCAKLLPRRAFSVVIQKCKDFKRWRCDACQRPTCTSCGVQEPKPLSRSITTGTHICYRCRYPPCTNGCGRSRPDTAKRYREEVPGGMSTSDVYIV
jgi:hypothetical protein